MITEDDQLNLVDAGPTAEKKKGSRPNNGLWWTM